MKKWSVYSLLLVLPTLLFSQCGFCVDLKPYKATYLLKWQGMHVGKSTHQVQQLGKHHFIIESISTPSLSFLPFESYEKSEFTIKKDKIEPKMYQYKTLDKGKKKEGTFRFDWNRKKLTHASNTSMTEIKPLQDNLHDKITYIIQLQKDLERRHQPLSYSVIEPKGLKTYHFTRQGFEILKTPMGNINTLKLVHISDNKERRTELWLAKDFNYLLIKLRQIRKGKVTAEGLITFIEQ